MDGFMIDYMREQYNEIVFRRCDRDPLQLWADNWIEEQTKNFNLPKR